MAFGDVAAGIVEATAAGPRSSWVDRVGAVFDLAGGVGPENVDWGADPATVARDVERQLDSCGVPAALGACEAYERARGSTLRELAVRLEVSAAHVSDIEHG